MPSEHLKPVFASICTHYPLDEGELQNLLDDLALIGSDTLQNRDIYLDKTSPMDFEIFLSEKELTTPSPGEYNAFEIDISSDDHLHAHTYSKIGDLDDILPLHNEVLGVSGESKLLHMNFYYELELPFSELGFETEEDYSIEGIRLSESNIEYSIGGHGDSTRVMTHYEGDQDIIDTDKFLEFVHDKVEITSKRINGLL